MSDCPQCGSNLNPEEVKIAQLLLKKSFPYHNYRQTEGKFECFCCKKLVGRKHMVLNKLNEEETQRVFII